MKYSNEKMFYTLRDHNAANYLIHLHIKVFILDYLSIFNPLFISVCLMYNVFVFFSAFFCSYHKCLNSHSLHRIINSFQLKIKKKYNNKISLVCTKSAEIWLRTGFNPADINRFWSHTGNNILILNESLLYSLLYTSVRKSITLRLS